tara:strand:+ start:480 stop:1223 length:744 start_codon:yes stop_codon:yes gene_type:complete
MGAPRATFCEFKEKDEFRVMKKEQVDKNSERFQQFSWDFSDGRMIPWTSVWLQAREIIRRPDIHRVLEFGSARNILKLLVENYGIHHTAVEVNGEIFSPDVVATIDGFESEETYDVVCAFEVLEHNPFEEIEGLVRKMASFSTKYVYLSIPCSGRFFSISLNANLPRIQFRKTFHWTWSRLRRLVRPVEEFRKRPDKYNPHWWEVGDKDRTEKDVEKLFENCDLKLIEKIHNPLFPYHLFFLLEKNG